MSNEWMPKIGEWVAVQVSDVDDEDDTLPVRIKGQIWLDRSEFRPIPPAITPEAQAVLDAVGPWVAEAKAWEAMVFPQEAALVDAYDTYAATLAPPKPVDPVEELQAAWVTFRDNDTIDNYNRLDAAIAAIAALRASREAK